MTQIDSSPICSTLKKIDLICSYFPVISTAISFIEIFALCVLNRSNIKTSKSMRYFSYINEKSDVRRILLLVPILGNMTVGIYDFTKHRLMKNCNEDLQISVQAHMLGLRTSQLPQNIEDQKAMIEEKSQENLRETINRLKTANTRKIFHLLQSIEKLKRVINNPAELVAQNVGIFLKPFNGTHRQKIDYCWSDVKYNFFNRNPNSFSEKKIFISHLDIKNIFLYWHEFSQQLDRIAELENDLLEVRRTSYRDRIKQIDQNELLHEARKYYFESFSRQKQERLENLLPKMTFTQLLPALQDRVCKLEKYPYKVIEMLEIIHQIPIISG